MRYNVITYLLGEGIRNVFKNKKSTSASIIIMSLTMLIFGVFFVITQNINSIMKQIESEQGIEVFLYDISEDQTKALEDYIRNIDGINTVEYKSKEDALNQLKSQFKDREDLLSGYDENNIFPASYVVTLTDLTKNNEVKQKIDEYDKDKPDTEKVIKKITSSDETITTLINLANGIRIITGVILVILIIISIFIISNTIKLTVHARRKEISIMKYVGATNSFIRWPFIVEGIIIGIISGAISIIILGINYNLIANKILESQVVSAMSINLLTFADMFGLIVLVYTILGVGIGILGSCISMRRYLKV
ncbi:MAG: permease-like cell division protein FtsX [Clostridia bacterium]|uniref:permease-like cell division protein FtsX n=1 Tax=Candidatus Merdicola sp. TaxID=3085652 RepID=UPI0015B5B3A9|nr:permease-like cell division protein FtsX [Clostridia bacterium]